ncbi:UPF0481 protein At3g47200-like [Telopea speciosissima]|uniref:UPF0481 protein At3g47200-like n=1 Tax=Telopea speciosissima TaxID=54955 RepID=UPI001CC5B220|nr:UPF0481 protein At3g47200-like [Telopea speciosissima]
MASTDERSFSVSIDRSEKRKMVIERSNEDSRSSTEPDIIADQREWSTTITKPSGSCPQWLLPILCEQETTSEKNAIDKVPITIRQGTEKRKDCFNPMVVSIGPYHNQDKDKEGNPKFARVEKLKASIAKEFIGGKTEELVKFEEVAHKAKAFYDKTSTANLSNDQFTRMMFLDGCFVLHSIDCILNKSYNTRMKTDQTAFVLRDLFLLENQLPFLVLEALMSFKPSKSEWEELIHKFVLKPLSLERKIPKEKVEWKHLLDLLHMKLICNTDQQRKLSEGSKMPYDDWQSFRSVIELKEAGIKCKKIKGGSFRDVSFKDGHVRANLFLPQLVVDDFTKSILLNLVAYEASPDGPSDYVVASFIVFLDALIDHAEDVKELRSKGIIHNLLGSDQQVADLFNELANNLVPSSSEYLDIKKGIETHCNKIVPKWMTDLWSTHFSSPWTVFAFFVAGSIIILTFAQTYFSIFPRGGGGEGERKAPIPSRKLHSFFD